MYRKLETMYRLIFLSMFALCPIAFDLFNVVKMLLVLFSKFYINVDFNFF